MPGKAAKVTISERQQALLLEICRRPSSSQQLAKRSEIILLAFEGKDNSQIAEVVRLERHSVGVWRRRWQAAFDRLIAVECGDSLDALRKAIVQVLSDETRSGTKPKFEPSQVAEIVAIACEHPDEEAERPVTHWTPTELAQEAKRRGIVESISPRQVGRFLKGRRTQAASEPVLAQSQAC